LFQATDLPYPEMLMNELIGTLHALPLADLLRHLATRRDHGRLLCRRSTEVVMLDLCAGAAVQVASTEPEHALSQLLLEKKLADPLAIAAFYRGEQPAHRHKSLGQALVAAYGADPLAIKSAIEAHVRATVRRLLSWPAGRFRFVCREPDSTTEGDMGTRIDLLPLCTVGRAPDERARAFRQSVHRRLAVRGRGKRFPADLQQQAVAYYQLRIGQGSFLTAVARELGLPPPTLRRWVLDCPPPTVSPLRLPLLSELPVPPEPPPQASATKHPVLVGPNGLRVEGLDLAGIADLLRRLDKEPKEFACRLQAAASTP
jgi:hypothetical protein